MKQDYLKVKDEENLVRDPKSNAILNTDLATLKAYKQRKQRESLLDTIVEENKQIKQDLKELKELLKHLIGQK